MKKLFFVVAALGVALLLAFRHAGTENIKINEAGQANPRKSIIHCSPDWNELKGWIDQVDIPPIPGAGIYKWDISTKNDSAQFYFNQGINMYYGFHIIEAMASFKKASRFDPKCGIIYWAQALTYGPNINDFGYRASPEALAAEYKALEYEATATKLERGLIEAMTIRYTPDSTDVTRRGLNAAYTLSMKMLTEKFRNNADVQALYADAMMLEHPWDLWNADGTPKPWTPLIRHVLEKLLAKSPYHPGANHYYIHVMEASPYAAKALPSAERLGKTNPGLSHLVHMPSHIYLRTGNYEQGVNVNINAIKSYQKTLSLFNEVAGNDFLYLIHNLHMKANNAMLEGNLKMSETSAFETRNSISRDYLSIPAPMGSYVQYIYMTPIMVYVRFGKWNELLGEPEPMKGNVYANVLFRFGRGMAFANLSRFAEAKTELTAIQRLMEDTLLNIPFTPFSPALDGAVVASKILSGTIALKEKRVSDAIIDFSAAVYTEQNMIYNEPRDWLLNPKHYLGNAYLIDGDGSNAEKTFRADLLNNDENGWALMGLYKALSLQNKLKEANQVLSRFKKAFSNADVTITAPVY